MASLKTPERIAVLTGMGVVSPIGIGRTGFFDALLNGESGIDFITHLDVSSFPSKIAGEVKGYEPRNFFKAREIQLSSRLQQWAMICLEEARRDAGLNTFPPWRTGVIFGQGAGALDEIAAGYDENPSRGAKYDPGADPYRMLRAFSGGVASRIAEIAGARGWVNTYTNACASSTNAFGDAARRIVLGEADVMITGGGDAPINYPCLQGFCRLGLLSESREPEAALRPFDQARDRFALGEGFAVLILEEKHRALERGARVYAEVTGFYHTTENIGATFPIDKTGRRWAEVMSRALAGGESESDLLIMAHAPGHVVTDAVEVKACKIALGSKIKDARITSIKAATGSGFAAAGAFQIAAAGMIFRHGQVPPTLNLEYPSPEFDLHFVTRRENYRPDGILINAHAVGNYDSALMLRAP